MQNCIEGFNGCNQEFFCDMRSLCTLNFSCGMRSSFGEMRSFLDSKPALAAERCQYAEWYGGFNVCNEKFILFNE